MSSSPKKEVPEESINSLEILSDILRYSSKSPNLSLDLIDYFGGTSCATCVCNLVTSLDI